MEVADEGLILLIEDNDDDVPGATADVVGPVDSTPFMQPVDSLGQDWLPVDGAPPPAEH